MGAGKPDSQTKVGASIPEFDRFSAGLIPNFSNLSTCKGYAVTVRRVRISLADYIKKNPKENLPTLDKANFTIEFVG